MSWSVIVHAIPREVLAILLGAWGGGEDAVGVSLDDQARHSLPGVTQIGIWILDGTAILVTSSRCKYNLKLLIMVLVVLVGLLLLW